MKWLMTLIFLLGAGVAGVYVYRTYIATEQDQRPTRAVDAEPAAEEEPAPKKKLISPEERERQAQLPKRRIISLDPSVAKARFGMSPQKLASIYKVVKRPAENGLVVLVHYLRTDRTQEARFIFEEDKLKRIEVVTKARRGERLEYLYRRIQSVYYQRYGKLPDSRRNRWSDRYIGAAVNKDDGAVTLSFSARE